MSIPKSKCPKLFLAVESSIYNLNVQGCDARMPDSNSIAGFINISSHLSAKSSRLPNVHLQMQTGFKKREQ